MFFALNVAKLFDDEICPPVKESGRVLFPYANICVIPLVNLLDDHCKYDINTMLLIFSVKQPSSKFPPHL